jgi:uncharacterized membrane protein YagU involved in acid resistance
MLRNETNARTLINVSLLAGLVAAVVEMIFVLPIQYRLGASPGLVFQSIASGALGRKAFDEGALAISLGICVHVLISLVSAAVFALTAMRWRILLRRPVVSGMLYGVLVYLVMSFVVIPLSAIGLSIPKSFGLFFMSFSVHIFAFGLPISLVCARLLK